MIDRRIATFLVLGVVASSCSRQRVWTYQANEYAPATASAGKAVVLPYRDARPGENSNMIAMYLVPLLPYGWTTQEIPESKPDHLTSTYWNDYKPVDDYPKALVQDLRNAGIFSDASFASAVGNADYVINGTIYSTEYSGKLLSYGLSGWGPFLWLFGAPAASTSNTLSVELTCTDRRSGRQILTKRYTPPPYDTTSFLYVSESDFNYAEMLASINKEFAQDLRTAMNAAGS
jgi:hypothetical protein